MCLFLACLKEEEKKVCVKEGGKLLSMHLRAFEMQEVQEVTELGGGLGKSFLGV